VKSSIAAAGSLLLEKVGECPQHLGLATDGADLTQEPEALVEEPARILVIPEVHRADADPVQEHADALLVAERPEERKALLVRRVRALVLP
jgi:hypothetical protein